MLSQPLPQGLMRNFPCWVDYPADCLLQSFLCFPQKRLILVKIPVFFGAGGFLVLCRLVISMFVIDLCLIQVISKPKYILCYGYSMNVVEQIEALGSLPCGCFVQATVITGGLCRELNKSMSTEVDLGRKRCGIGLGQDGKKPDTFTHGLPVLGRNQTFLYMT